MIDKIMASLLSLVSFFYFFIADSEKGLTTSWILMGSLLILYFFLYLLLVLFSGNPNFFSLIFLFLLSLAIYFFPDSDGVAYKISISIFIISLMIKIVFGGKRS